MQGLPKESLVGYNPGHDQTVWPLLLPMVESPHSPGKKYSHKSTEDGGLIGGTPWGVTLKDFEGCKQCWRGAPPIDLSESCQQTLRSGTACTLDRIYGGLA